MRLTIKTHAIAILSVGLFAGTCSVDALAEYYLVRSGPNVVDMGTCNAPRTRCRSRCNETVVDSCRRPSSYSISVKLYYPACPTACPTPCDGVPCAPAADYVSGLAPYDEMYYRGVDVTSFYGADEVVVETPSYDPDLATADDDAFVDPDMDIDH